MRTFSGTPKEVTVISKWGGGQYIYFGLARPIKQVLLKQPSAKSDELPPQLQINIDGLPLFKCTSDQFWPILGSFGSQEVFLIGLFYGKSKPDSLEEYLKDFLEELDVLQNKGHTVLLRNNLTENAFGTRPERVRKCVPFAFHLRSIRVPFAFHSRSICVPFAFHLRSIRVPFAFHLRSNLRSTFTGTHPGTRSSNARNKIEYHRKIS